MEMDSQEVEAEFDGGWVKMFRQLQNERVFHDPHLWQLYCHLMFKARHKAGAVALQVAGNTTTVWLKVGQCIVGRNMLGEELNCKSTTAWDRLKRLEGFGMITVESDSHKSVVSVINYQGSHYVEPVDVDKQVTAKRQPVGKRLTSSRQPSDTNKKGKNVKNDKNETIESESIGTPSQEEIKNQIRQYIEEYNEPRSLEQKRELEEVKRQMSDDDALMEELKSRSKKVEKGSPEWNQLKSEHDSIRDGVKRYEQDQKRRKLETSIQSESVRLSDDVIEETSRQFWSYIEAGRIQASKWKEEIRIWVNRDINRSRQKQMSS